MISLFSSKLNASYEKLAFDFSFKDLDGSEMKLADFKNKVMVSPNPSSNPRIIVIQKLYSYYLNKTSNIEIKKWKTGKNMICLLYTSPSPRDRG